MWLLFLCLHLIGLVGYNLILRKSLLSKQNPWTLATVMQTGIAIPAVFIFIARPPHHGTYDLSSLLLVLGSISLVIFLHLTNVQTLKHLEAGVAAILYNLRIIFTTILGIVFLGEPVIPLQIFGGLLIFAAVLTVKQKGRQQVTRRGIEWGVTAAVVISILNVFEKELIKGVGYTSYVIPVMLGAAVIMWCIFFMKGLRISPKYFLKPSTLLLMSLRAMSAYFFTLAFWANAPLSVATYISSLSVVIIVLLGAKFLHENDYMKQKLIAAGLALLGLTCVLIANLIK